MSKPIVSKEATQYVEQLVQIKCRGVNHLGRKALKTAIDVTIDIHKSPGMTSISIGPKQCPHNTGGHNQRCKAAHPEIDKIENQEAGCPFSFDYPYVLEYSPGWKAPSEIEPALRIVAETI